MGTETTEQQTSERSRVHGLFLRWWKSQSLTSEPERSKVIARVAYEAGMIEARRAGTPTTEARLLDLLNRWTIPCEFDCEHSQCPLLRELWTMTEERRIKKALEKAQETVRPIVDEEKKSEDVGGLMNMRLHSSRSSSTPSEPAWSDTFPTVSGWYWLRVHSDTEGYDPTLNTPWVLFVTPNKFSGYDGWANDELEFLGPLSPEASTPSDEVAQRAEKFEVALRQIAASGKSYDWQSLAIKRRDIARTALGLDGAIATDVEQGREKGEGDG